MRGYVYLLFSLWCLPALLPGQAPPKFEREYRLNAQDVPLRAANFIAACPFTTKVRWYGEESEDGYSIEAKSKKQGVHYSIEFDTSGQVQDVEVLTPFPALPTAVQDSICQQLTQQFDGRFRLMRIQRQWIADSPETLRELISTGTTKEVYTENYEIVVRAKTSIGIRWYEYLFATDGRIIRQQQIVFRNTDNLDY